MRLILLLTLLVRPRDQDWLVELDSLHVLEGVVQPDAALIARGRRLADRQTLRAGSGVADHLGLALDVADAQLQAVVVGELEVLHLLTLDLLVEDEAEGVDDALGAPEDARQEALVGGEHVVGLEGLVLLVAGLEGAAEVGGELEVGQVAGGHSQRVLVGAHHHVARQLLARLELEGALEGLVLALLTALLLNLVVAEEGHHHLLDALHVVAHADGLHGVVLLLH